MLTHEQIRRALSLWDHGSNALTIAQILRVPESEIYTLINSSNPVAKKPEDVPK